MRVISASEATTRMWAASQIIILDATSNILRETADIDKIKSASLWNGRVMDFGLANDSKPHAGKAVASIGAIDNNIIVEVYDYNA